MATYELHNWSIIRSCDLYTAPEAAPIRLVGYRNRETRRVITSAIIAARGRVITTYSGSTYILKDIEPKYLEWMKENKIEFDPQNPIKVIL